MRISVRLFAMQRQQTGLRQLMLDVPEGATVMTAWRALVTAHPTLEPAGTTVRFARNGVYADGAEQLEDGDELAVIPPVSGGDGRSGQPRMRRLELHDAPFGDDLLAQLRREVPGPADGALAMFVGQTRESPGAPAPGQGGEAARFGGHPVEHLTYEAFAAMALDTLAAIADEIESRFGVRRLAILHRIGEVPLGEGSVVIAAAAPHREEAFAACRYAIEELKARAPIWKAEHFADGSVWVGAPARMGPVDDGGGDP